MFELLTLDGPVAIVVIPKPIRPMTAGFAQSGGACELADDCWDTFSVLRFT